MLFKTNIDATFTTNPTERKQMKKPLLAVIGSILLVLSLTACGSETTSASDTTSVTDTTEETTTEVPIDNGFTDAENEFLYDVHNVDNPVIERNTDEQIVSVGHTVCETLDSGETVTTISNYLMSTGDYEGDTDIEFVAAMVAGAITDLCPEYKYQLP